MMVPADGALSTPTPHLLPEAGARAEVRLACMGPWVLMCPTLKDGAPWHITTHKTGAATVLSPLQPQTGALSHNR